jgi:hypothetical protein
MVLWVTCIVIHSQPSYQTGLWPVAIRGSILISLMVEQHELLPNFHVITISVAAMDQNLFLFLVSEILGIFSTPGHWPSVDYISDVCCLLLDLVSVSSSIIHSILASPVLWLVGMFWTHYNPWYQYVIIPKIKFYNPLYPQSLHMITFPGLCLVGMFQIC